jgi:hypothetical protein
MAITNPRKAQPNTAGDRDKSDRRGKYGSWGARAGAVIVLAFCATAVAVFVRGRPSATKATNNAASSSSARGTRVNAAPAGSVSAEQSPARRDPFLLGIGAAIASEADGVALVHKHASTEGEVLEPIQVGVIVEVTNQQKQEATLSSLSVDVAVKGGWLKLVDSPPRVLDRVYVPGSDGSLRDAARLNFGGRAFATTEAPPQIQPGRTVKGWAFFLFPAGYEGKKGSECRFRVTVEDALGAKGTAEISRQLADPRSFFFESGSDSFYVPGDKADIRGLPLAVPEYLLPRFRALQSRLGSAKLRLQPPHK